MILCGKSGSGLLVVAIPMVEFWWPSSSLARERSLKDQARKGISLCLWVLPTYLGACPQMPPQVCIVRYLDTLKKNKKVSQRKFIEFSHWITLSESWKSWITAIFTTTYLPTYLPPPLAGHFDCLNNCLDSYDTHVRCLYLLNMRYIHEHR